MNKLIEKMFANRGYTPEYLQDINCSEHDVLLDLDIMCSKLNDILSNNRKIVILPDFDMDGIMAGTLGFAGLAELGFNVSLFIPDPKDGYGFTKATIKRLIREYPMAEAILTCDVGSTCYEGIDYAKSLGMICLVTDHHMMGTNLNADVIINPKRQDETYSHPGICGAYVLYQVLQYYADNFCQVPANEQIRRLRVFAGIGTVSDLMPLLYENRGLVKDAVDICRMIYAGGDDKVVSSISGCDTYRRAFHGLHAVLCAFSDAGKLPNLDSLDEQFFGFYLAPAFNCLKRMDKDLKEAFGVFFDNNQIFHANNLIAWNEERKVLEQQYMQALDMIPQPYAPFVYFSYAPAGFLGLLANKLMLMSNLPTVVLSEKNGGFSGSGRSFSWYPLLEKAVLNQFTVAGHNEAFGISFKNAQEVEAFHLFIKEDVSDVLSTLEFEDDVYDFVISSYDDSSFVSDTYIDLPLFEDYLQEIKKYKPFGKMFARPRVLLRFKANEGAWNTMGSLKQHVKITLDYGFEVLLWNQSQHVVFSDTDEEICVVGDLNMSMFNKKTTINFVGVVQNEEIEV